MSQITIFLLKKIRYDNLLVHLYLKRESFQLERFSQFSICFCGLNILYGYFNHANPRMSLFAKKWPSFPIVLYDIPLSLVGQLVTMYIFYANFVSTEHCGIYSVGFIADAKAKILRQGHKTRPTIICYFAKQFLSRTRNNGSPRRMPTAWSVIFNSRRFLLVICFERAAGVRGGL